MAPLLQLIKEKTVSEDPRRQKLYRLFYNLQFFTSNKKFEELIFLGLSLLRCTDPSFLKRRSDQAIEWILKQLSFVSTHFLSPQPPIVSFLTHQVTFPFQNKNVLGLLIQVPNSLLSLADITALALSDQPSWHLVGGSSFVLPAIDSSFTSFYFELQNELGIIHETDAHQLTKNLPQKLIEESENGFLPRIFPNNRELLMKNFRTIMGEISSKDLPQVFIDFTKQTTRDYQFSALICRYKTQKDPPMAQLLSSAGAHIDGTTTVHALDGLKEGVICTLDIPIIPDLTPHDARRQCGCFIHSTIGPYRDINGGLSEKIDENFDQLVSLLPTSKKLIKSFFYRIVPQDRQATTPPGVLIRMFETLEKEKKQLKRMNLLVKEGSDDVLISIQLCHPEFEKAFRLYTLSNFPQSIFSAEDSTHHSLVCCAIYNQTPQEVKRFKSLTLSFYQDWIQKSKLKQHITVGCTTYFSSFDPRIGTEEETSYLHNLLFEGLMRKGKNGKPEPGVAKKVKISENRCCYRFYLRDSYWSDGRPVTAYDFEHSWKTSLTPSFLSPLCYFFYPIKNAKKIKEGKLPIDTLGVKALQPNILEVSLDYPNSYFLDLCTHSALSPVCRPLDLSNPSWPESHENGYICNGPFTLEKKLERGDLALRKNSLYWDHKDIPLETIRFLMLKPTHCISLFKKKEIDILPYPLNKSPLSQSLPNSKKWKAQLHSRYLCFNCSMPLFKNQKIRTSLSLALNREELANKFSKEAQPLYTFYSPEFTQNLSTINKQNIMLANRLLELGLKEIGETKKSQTCLRLTTTYSHQELGTLICKQLNQNLQLNCTLELVGYDQMICMAPKGQLQLSIMGWINQIANPSYFLEIFSSKKNPINHSLWFSTSLQKKIRKIHTTSSEKKLKLLHAECESLFIEELPMAPLIYTRTHSLTQQEVALWPGPKLSAQFNLRNCYKQDS
ncbi:MAG: peptide ABC transporter substrate-binding protein [Chlamydiia bacterium]|nr:peptide ABC transporter substrate-binding protein [Chlamydiia bacterium]